MNKTGSKTKIIKWETKGTCCKLMQVELLGDIIQNVEFVGGCDGNLKGLQALLKGMAIDEVIEKLSGISCDAKSTSCPDQLALCLREYKTKN